MFRTALLALCASLLSCGGAKVIRTEDYRRVQGLPSDLGVVLVGDATYAWNETTRERVEEQVGTTLCPELVRMFKSTDTFSMVRCVVVPSGDPGEERALPLGKEELEMELPADGSSYSFARRESPLLLFLHDLKVLNELAPEDRGAGAGAFKRPVTLFGTFAWWDNQNGALISYQGLDGTTARLLMDGGDPQWDDLAWFLSRSMGTGMPFEFTW